MVSAISVPGRFGLGQSDQSVPCCFGPWSFLSMVVLVPGLSGTVSFRSQVVSDRVISVSGHGCICATYQPIYLPTYLYMRLVDHFDTQSGILPLDS